MMKWFVLGSVIAPSYVIYKIVEVMSNTSGDEIYRAAAFCFCAAMFFALRILLVTWALACRTNFGHGLKERAFEKQSFVGTHTPYHAIGQRSTIPTRDSTGSSAFPSDDSRV